MFNNSYLSITPGKSSNTNCHFHFPGYGVLFPVSQNIIIYPIDSQMYTHAG